MVGACCTSTCLSNCLSSCLSPCLVSLSVVLSVCLSVCYSMHIFLFTLTFSHYLPHSSPPRSLARMYRKNYYHLTTQSASIPRRGAAPPVPGLRPARSSSRPSRSSSVVGGVSRTICAATARSAPRLPPKSSGRRKGETTGNPGLLRDPTANGSAAHPLPYGVLGGGTGLSTTGRRWAPAEGWRDVCDDGGRSFMPERFAEPFARDRGGGDVVRQDDSEGISGGESGAEAEVSGGEGKEVVHNRLSPTLAALERVDLTTNDVQGRCVGLSHGESYGEFCTAGSCNRSAMIMVRTWLSKIGGRCWGWGWCWSWRWCWCLDWGS